MNEFILIKSRYESMESDEKKLNQPELKAYKPQFKVYNDNDFVEKSLEMIQFSIAVNDVKSAKKIRKKAIKTVNNNRLRDFKID